MLKTRYQELGWWTGERLIDRFQGYVEANGDAPAVVAGEISLTRQELWDMAGKIADNLLVHGCQPGQVVVVYLPNSTAWMLAFVASLRAGLIPASPPITTPREHIHHIVDLTQANLIITCRQYRNDSSAQIAIEASRNAQGAPGVLVLGDDGEQDWLAEPTLNAPIANVPELAHMMFTSGTTGEPKAVMHTEDTLATLNRQFAERFSLDETTPIFMASPMGHSVGAMHGARLSMYTGCLLVIQYSWDPIQALELVEAYGAAFTAAATPFLVDLVEAKWPADRLKLASLRYFLCGGAQVPPELVRRSRIELPKTFLTPLWGMTEGGLTTCLSTTSPEKLETTVGVGLPDLELRILGENDEILGVNQQGELAMRGPGVFVGYFGQEDLYREQLTADGFFRTGDLAHIDEEGYTSITGRAKDLIIRGGVNIAPVMTENMLMAHPKVRAAALIGWPDGRLGERLCAAIVPTADAKDNPPTFDELIQFCTEQGLHRRYYPEFLFVVDEFPRTAAGKIRKHILKEKLLLREDNDHSHHQ